MPSNPPTAILLAAALIACVVGIVLASLAMFYRAAWARRAASWTFLAAWSAHGLAVVQQGRFTGGFPLTNPGEYLLLLGWAVMTLHLVVWFHWRVDAAGLMLPPIVALSGSAALPLLLEGTTRTAVMPRGLFLFHTTVATLGMATLTLTLAMSVIYLVQDRALKSRRSLGVLERLPPLDRCDQIGFHALVIGFVLLSLGIGTGMVVNRIAHDRIWIVDLKQTLPLVAWFLFAVVLLARRLLGFRGRKAAYLTIAGVVVGLMTVVGMTY